MKRMLTAATAAAVLALAGCAPSSPSESAAPASTPANPPAATPPMSGTATEEPIPAIDLSAELRMNPAVVIGTTTYAELEKSYGPPVVTRDVKSAFRRNLTSDNPNPPQIEETLAFFKVNPLTGEPGKKGYPLYFTKDERKVLAAAPVLLLRGELKNKLKQGNITLDDVKQAYGTPTRESSKGLEYYDFQNKAVLHVFVNDEGKLVSLLTKYDQLYTGNSADLAAHEEIIRRLSAQAQ